MNIKHTGTKYLREYSLHLKNLPEHDRYTRFGAAVGDSTIDSFILSILYSPDKHRLFTAKEKGKIVGFSHLAVDHGDTWELAVSVDADHQGKGAGDRLMAAAIEWAKMHNIQSMFMHCITENKKIQHLARKHNLRVAERSGTDITAQMELPEPTAVDYFRQFIGRKNSLIQQITKLNFRLFKL